ncbi:MAG TPA: copper resistance protein CopC [Marmoricola sp.]|jgi:copper transport protein|nr:copper resistance protein CopC [Marmoricola sp.]
MSLPLLLPARVVRRLVLAAALALAGSLLLVGPASAHASLLFTDPSDGAVVASAPSVARLTFDEPIGSVSGGVEVFDAKGDVLKTSAHTQDDNLLVDLPSGMKDGTYIIAWRVISADGHPVGGSLTFSVGAPSAKVAAKTVVPEASPPVVRGILGIAQGATYLGVFGACGLVVFLVLLFPRASGLEQFRNRLLDLGGWFAWLTLIAGFVLLPFTSLYQRANGLGALTDSVTWHDADRGSQAVSALLLALGTTLAVGLARRGASVKRWLTLGVVTLTLLTLSLVGHTRSVKPMWLLVASDLSHVTAGSIWFGGLLGLVIGLRRLSDRPKVAADMLGRFSTLAGFLLATVAVTGTILAWRILGSWSNFFHTDYGYVLLVKIGSVSLIALVGAWNRYKLVPRVLADAGFADRRTASSMMTRTVRVEALLLVCVLGLTGFLVDRSPVQATGQTALPGGFDSSTFSGQTGGVRVVASIKPAETGENSVTIQVQDSAGDPIEPAQAPIISFSLGTLGLGDQAVTDVDSGTYTADVLIPKAGTWTLSVSVKVTQFDNPVVSIKVPVRKAP